MDTLAQCLDAGAHHYFLKPINFDEFHHALEATARHHLEQREQKHVRRRLESTIARQTRKIRRTFLSAIDSMVRLLEARDPYTSGHSLRVSAYVVRMGRILDMDPRSIQRLHVAAKLHDIGKVGLPEA